MYNLFTSGSFLHRSDRENRVHVLESARGSASGRSGTSAA